MWKRLLSLIHCELLNVSRHYWRVRSVRKINKGIWTWVAALLHCDGQLLIWKLIHKIEKFISAHTSLRFVVVLGTPLFDQRWWKISNHGPKLLLLRIKLFDLSNPTKTSGLSRRWLGAPKLIIWGKPSRHDFMRYLSLRKLISMTSSSTLHLPFPSTRKKITLRVQPYTSNPAKDSTFSHEKGKRDEKFTFLEKSTRKLWTFSLKLVGFRDYACHASDPKNNFLFQIAQSFFFKSVSKTLRI